MAVVHNGVIENFRALEERLDERRLQVPVGDRHRGDRPPDRLANSTRRDPASRPSRPIPTQPLVEAVQAALAQLRGTYGLAMVFRDWPDVIIAARLGSPLVIGVGDGEHFIASDASPLAGPHRQDRLPGRPRTGRRHRRLDPRHPPRRGRRRATTCSVLEIDAGQVELGGFPHYMLKEIFEQPESIRNAMRGRLDRDDGDGRVRRAEPHAAATAAASTASC